MADVAKILGQVPGDLDKIHGVDASTVGKIHGGDFSAGIAIPSGLIVPFRGAGGVPSGWSIYNTADGAMIVGAGSTYAVDDNAAGSGNINLSHIGAGSHLGASVSYGANNAYCGFTTDPTHTHTTMTFTGPEPWNNQHRLIKADSEQESLPQDACLMKHAVGGWTGLTRLTPVTYDRLFMANSSDGTGGLITAAVTSSSNNAHNHDGTSGLRPAGGGAAAWGAQISMLGAHIHSFSATLAFNMYRVQLSAWYMASGAYELDGENFIGMYENVTPPDKWSLCNGTGGTPDMRNYFVELPLLDANAGSSKGTGNVTCTTVSEYTGAHTHSDTGTCNSCPREISYHHVATGNHSHTCNHNAAWLPPYYALAFIMYTG